MVVVGSDVCFVVMALILLPTGGSGGGCRFRRLLCPDGVEFVADRWIWWCL